MAALYFDSSTGWMLPVDGSVTQGYGPANTDPALVHLYRKGYHTGIDIGGVSEGTVVLSPCVGVVALAGRYGGYGNCVILDRDEGVSVLFGHLSQIDVLVGQLVVIGDSLGGVGSTGVSTGVHLHYEYRRNGEDIDPRPFMEPEADPFGIAATVREALNLREGPTMSDAVIVVAPVGAHVRIGLGGWVPVSYDGREGWMFAEYLSVG